MFYSRDFLEGVGEEETANTSFELFQGSSLVGLLFYNRINHRKRRKILFQSNSDYRERESQREQIDLYSLGQQKQSAILNFSLLSDRSN